MLTNRIIGKTLCVCCFYYLRIAITNLFSSVLPQFYSTALLSLFAIHQYLVNQLLLAIGSTHRARGRSGTRGRLLVIHIHQTLNRVYSGAPDPVRVGKRAGRRGRAQSILIV